MHFAFILFKYFPFGGLQKDFLRIAEACLSRQHKIDVYTMQWEGDNPLNLPITQLPSKKWQNHSRQQDFVEQLNKALSNKAYDLCVGFNKIPGLDVYFSADTCFQAKSKKKHGLWYQLLPRCRHLIHYERSVFAHEMNTQILTLTPEQKHEFINYYNTEDSRFHTLVPGILSNSVTQEKAAEIRKNMRERYQIKNDEFLILLVGSGFKTKGVDRLLHGIAALPMHLKKRARLFILGKDHAKPFQKLSTQLNVAVCFLGGSHEVRSFMLAADLLVHPAYHESAGAVLLEAVVSGLPVLTTDVCGYAPYITKARAGIVLKSPFHQNDFNQALEKMLMADREHWKKNACEYARTADIYRLHQQAAEIIEAIGNARVPTP